MPHDELEAMILEAIADYRVRASEIFPIVGLQMKLQARGVPAREITGALQSMVNKGWIENSQRPTHMRLTASGFANFEGLLVGTPKVNDHWDAFISHASEDKENFVRPLAQGLSERGLNIWFDEFTLTVGAKLRRSIDQGLAQSRFGIVVISPNFLQKEWPQRELDGLVAREIVGSNIILPVWHHIDVNAIRRYSPMLADRLAVSSSDGVDHVVEELMRAINRNLPHAHSLVAPADVRVSLTGSYLLSHFNIKNLGKGSAFDVQFKIANLKGRTRSPLILDDIEEKLPIGSLTSNETVRLAAALTYETGTVFRALWSWRNNDGSVEERNARVELQY